MRVLIVHQNAPAQYKHIIASLARDPANQVVVLSQRGHGAIPGAHWVVYGAPDLSAIRPHRYLGGVETAVHNAEAVMQAARQLKQAGFTPDVMLGHNAWGETLFLKDVWPDTPLLAFFEFFYHGSGTDVDFDPEFPGKPDDAPRLRARNATNLLGLEAADWGQSPTQWQRAQYPEVHRRRISVFHDGIDTQLLRPNPEMQVSLGVGKPTLRAGDEIITYVSRNLEPYRGFHPFMRALPEVLRRRPKARVVIVGGDEVSYGLPHPSGRPYREVMLEELGDRLDLSRVHFLGPLPYDHYRAILQVSSAHVYLTYPFVLSWSMLEAMSSGCLLIGSATPPVQEVITDGENGLLVDFFQPEALAERLVEALERPDRMVDLRRRARETVLERYDLATVCLPRFLSVIDDLVNRREPPLDPTVTAPPAGSAGLPAGMVRLDDAMRMAAEATRAGDLAGAEHLYTSILRHRADHAEALYELGLVLFRQRRVMPALALLERAIALEPARGNFLADYGVVSNALRRHQVRITCYRRALALTPDNHAILMNLGAALYDLGEIAESEAACLRSLELRPGHFGALANLANAQVKLGKLDEAVANYRQALAINPQSPDIRNNLGMILLLQGNLTDGAAYYEDRLKTISSEARDFPQPRWTGEPLEGRTLFLYAEQGIGDTLHFARYVPLIKAKGPGRIVIEAQRPLVPLMKTLEGCDGIVAKDAEPPPFDLHCPLLSLLHACGTTLDTIPANVPYLSADPAAVARWAPRIPDRGRPRVGLVWGGSALHMNDRMRSIPLKQLHPVMDLEGIDLYSLQVGPPRDQIAALGLQDRLPDLGADFADFAETAAAAEHLDLIVAVDTSVVHLAGALGRPCWVLLPYSPDWRWLLDREDTPWYPSVRLLRQGPDASWGPVIDRLAGDLARLAERHGARGAALPAL